MAAEPHKMLGRSARTAVTGALLVIGAVAMYNWVVSPHVAYLQAVQQLEPAVERMAAENDRIRRSLGRDIRRLQSVRRERAAVQEGLFADTEFAALIRNLPALVEQTGCTVVVADFTGGGGPGADPDAAFTVRHAGLTVRGTLDQVTALLDRLQKHRPKVWIDALRMERGAARPDLTRAGADAGQPAEPGVASFKCQLAMTMYTLTPAAPGRSQDSTGPVP